MTARQPRRARRRTPPTTTLPRPVADHAADVGVPATSTGMPRPDRHSTRPREHHVTEDYSYVKGDLLLIGVVGAVSIAFIVAMSFVL